MQLPKSFLFTAHVNVYYFVYINISLNSFIYIYIYIYTGAIILLQDTEWPNTKTKCRLSESTHHLSDLSNTINPIDKSIISLRGA